MKAAKLKNAWNSFFFKEVPVEGIAIFRILLGLITLFTFFNDAIMWQDLWGPEAIQTVKTGMKNYSFPVLNIFQYFAVSEGSVLTLIAINMVALICFTIGFKTRFFALIAFILLVSFNQRNVNLLNSADLLIRILFMYMIFAPSYKAYSIDSLLAKIKGKPFKRDHACWVHRLIQLQIAVCYVSTVIAKSKGHTWFDGSAVYYATRISDFTRFAVPFILDWKWSIMLITWSTLIIEFSLGTLIFIDELKKPLIVLGIVFHLGIEYMMSIPTFEWLMIILLLMMFKFSDYRSFDIWFKNHLRKFISNRSMDEQKKEKLTRYFT